MTHFLRSPLHALLAAALLALGGCSTAAQPAASSVPAPSAGGEDMAQLRQLVGDAGCSDDGQCRTLAWGHTACGGPERYVAWSTARSDGAALQKLAQTHAERQKQAQEKKGMVSNCAYVADPGAQCVANRCVLRNSGNRGALVQ